MTKKKCVVCNDTVNDIGIVFGDYEKDEISKSVLVSI